LKRLARLRTSGLGTGDSQLEVNRDRTAFTRASENYPMLSRQKLKTLWTCFPIAYESKPSEDALLYKRIVETGTLSEPGGVPDPQFALPSTVNWMRALALIIADTKLNFTTALQAYTSVQRRSFSSQEENSILEQLFFALHQLSALEAFRSVPRRADVARMGIVTWYYGIYYAASAMIAAQDGSIQDDHASTANSWDRHFAERGLALPPFELRVSTLVEKQTKAEIAQLRAGNRFDLKTVAIRPVDALGACCAYLSGTSNWYRWRVTEDLRQSKEYRALGVGDFRTKAAQQLRDQRLARKSVSFLHQAIRYRGKANYREALFLGYGASTETLLAGYVDDLASVLGGFVSMAGAFASKRLGKTLWTEFIDDVQARRAFSVQPAQVWA
jgi:hypothetical protein